MNRRPQAPEHVVVNREYWDRSARDWVVSGERLWSLDDPEWGIWNLRESELKLLPQRLDGLRTVELGCGTGYVSGWMTRRGAVATGLDNSVEQLRTARRLAAQHGMCFPLVHSNAETTPFANESFDYAFSEYGAAIWCDPNAWIPEAHRILRPGGRLTFLGTHPWVHICTPVSGEACEERLHTPYFSLRKQDWREVEDPGGIEFNLPLSDWFALFRSTGFEVLDFRELRAPESLTEERFSIPASWAQKWPSEQVWTLRKLDTDK